MFISPLAAEKHALADAAEMEILVQHDLYSIYGTTIPINLLTDANSLSDVLAKGSATTEKRLMIDVSATRQAYDDEDINGLIWIRRE